MLIYIFELIPPNMFSLPNYIIALPSITILTLIDSRRNLRMSCVDTEIKLNSPMFDVWVCQKPLIWKIYCLGRVMSVALKDGFMSHRASMIFSRNLICAHQTNVSRIQTIHVAVLSWHHYFVHYHCKVLRIINSILQISDLILREIFMS